MSFIPVDIFFYQHKEISRNEQLSSFVLVMSRNLMNQTMYMYNTFWERELWSLMPLSTIFELYRDG